MFTLANLFRSAYNLPLPAIFIASNIIITIFVAWYAYKVILNLLPNKFAALFGGLLVAIHPAKNATLFWYSSIIANFELLLFLISVYLIFMSKKRDKTSLLIFSALIFVLAIFTYNFAIFMSPALLLLTLYTWKDSLKKIWPFAATYVLASALLVYFKIHFFVQGSKQIVEMHLIKTIGTTLNNNFGFEFFRLGNYAFMDGIKSLLGDTWLIIIVLVLVIITVLFLQRLTPKNNKSRRFIELGAFGLTLFLLASLAMAKSTYFSPASYSVMNRVNVFPSLGLIMILIALIGYLFTYKHIVGKIILPLAVVYFILVNIGVAGYYKYSYRYQKNVINFIASNNDKIIASDRPQLILLNEKYLTMYGVPVISDPWTVKYMLNSTLGTNDHQFYGTVVSNQLEYGNQEIIDHNLDTKFPYQGYLVDYDNQIFERFSNQSEFKVAMTKLIKASK